MSSQLLENKTTKPSGVISKSWQNLEGSTATVPSAMMRNLFDANDIDFEIDEDTREEFSPTRLVEAIQKQSMQALSYNDATYQDIGGYDVYSITDTKTFIATTLKSPISDEERYGEEIDGVLVKTFKTIPHNSLFVFFATQNSSKQTKLKVSTNIVRYDNGVQELQSLESIDFLYEIITQAGTSLSANDITRGYNIVKFDSSIEKFVLVSSLNKTITLTKQTIGNQTITQWKDADGNVIRQEIIGIETTVMPSNTNRTIIFSVSFSSPPIVIPMTGAPSPNNGILVLQVEPIGTSQFVLQFKDPDSSLTSYSWIAISK